LAGIDKGEEKLSVRADWYTDAAVTGSDQPVAADPFSNASQDEQDRGRNLTLNSTAEQFRAGFKRLLNWANRLDGAGIKCPLREAGECHCTACPISQAHDPEGERYSLCRQGVEEERMVMLARIAQHPELIPSGGV
jgi:hypothetical protein